MPFGSQRVRPGAGGGQTRGETRCSQHGREREEWEQSLSPSPQIHTIIRSYDDETADEKPLHIATGRRVREQTAGGRKRDATSPALASTHTHSHTHHVLPAAGTRLQSITRVRVGKSSRLGEKKDPLCFTSVSPSSNEESIARHMHRRKRKTCFPPFSDRDQVIYSRLDAAIYNSCVCVDVSDPVNQTSASNAMMQIRIRDADELSLSRS